VKEKKIVHGTKRNLLKSHKKGAPLKQLQREDRRKKKGKKYLKPSKLEGDVIGGKFLNWEKRERPSTEGKKTSLQLPKPPNCNEEKNRARIGLTNKDCQAKGKRSKEREA